MTSGWIKLHRRIMDDDYFHEPFNRKLAWIDLLLLANFTDASIRKRGILVLLKRGDVGLSLEEMANRWKWSKGKVIRFLDELERKEQIITQKNNITCCITIINYNEYQDGDNTDGTQTGMQIDSQTDTQTERKRVRNKKNKESKEEKKNTGATAPIPTLKLVTEIDTQYEAFNNWLVKNAPRVLKMKKPIDIDEYSIFKKKCSTDSLKELMKKTLLGMQNRGNLLRNYVSASATLDSWMEMAIEKNPSLYEIKPANGLNATQQGQTTREREGEEAIRAVIGGD